MEELKILLQKILNKDLQQIILSNSRNPEQIQKVKIRPVLIRDELLFKETRYKGTQVFHENYTAAQMTDGICAALQEQFRQGEFTAKSLQATALVSKKGKLTLKVKNNGVSKTGKSTAPEQEDLQALSHNRTKHYILEEGKPVDFLVGLGVQTPDGRVTKARFDKFRQINRFLEFIEDILPQLDRGRELTILDFGCGKSYLTFAMYYYLHELKKYDIRIIGLDLKSEVIRHCNELAEKYGYEKLQFLEGDIADYEGVNRVDMVVTLHACNTATDYALAKAVGWNAKVILSVPCCQHEINEQFEAGETPEVLATVMEYGLLRERFAALVTDGLRAKYLESEGYETQVLEFIDMEHTPKNILLRAVRRGKTDGAIEAESRKKLEECEAFLNIQPTLGRLLSEKSRHR